jgi:hypothetical protein
MVQSLAHCSGLTTLASHSRLPVVEEREHEMQQRVRMTVLPMGKGTHWYHTLLGNGIKFYLG